MAALGLKTLPSVERLSTRVIRVLGQNPGPYTLQGTNTYLVGTGRGHILIDTGEALELDEKEEKSKFTKVLGDVLDSERATLEAVVFTHWHLDHTGGLDTVLRLVKARGDAFPTLHKFGGWRGMAETREGHMESESGDAFGSSSSSSSSSTSSPFSSTHPYPEGTPAAAAAAAGLSIHAIKDGDTLKTAGATLRASHTPGHAWDHLCLWLEEEKSMFCADNVLGQGSTVFENLAAYMNSLRSMLSVITEAGDDSGKTRLYPGHG